jgi:hypothetical protein
VSEGEAVPEEDRALEEASNARRAEKQQRVTQLRHEARADFRAMAGWQRVTTPEAWEQTCREAGTDYRSGRFLIERLGASRHLDPELMATLWGLRQQLLDEGSGSAAETMLADLAVTSYYNALRIQQWIGNLALATEREFFGEEGPSARFERRYERVEGLVVERQLERMGEELLPLQERANRMVIRNLKALADLRRRPAPSVAIGQAGQVNVGAQQVNVTGAAVPSADETMADNTASGNVSER